MSPVDQERVAARGRHPATQNPLTAAALRRRVAERLRSTGMRHADVAAALLHLRGVAGTDEHRFARRVGVDVELLRRAEAGGVALHDLPPALRRLVAQELSE